MYVSTICSQLHPLLLAMDSLFFNRRLQSEASSEAKEVNTYVKLFSCEIPC